MPRGSVVTHQEPGHTHPGLPGRFADFSELGLGIFGIYDKQREEQSYALSENLFLRVGAGLIEVPGSVVTEEDISLQSVSVAISAQTHDNTPSLPAPSGLYGFNDISNPAWFANDEEVSALVSAQTETLATDDGAHTSLPVVPARTAPLERRGLPQRRSSAGPSVLPCAGHHRRLEMGLGRTVQKQICERRLDGGSEAVAHQRIGVDGHLSLSETFQQDGAGVPSTRPDPLRQSLRSILHKQTGRDSVTRPSPPHSLSAVMVQHTPAVTQSDTYSGNSEPRSRSALQGISPGERVETSPGDSTTDMGSLRQGQRRSVRLQGKRPLSYVLLASGRERASRSRRVGTRVASSAPLRIPSGLIDPAHPGTCAPREVDYDSSRSSLDKEGLVCRNNIVASGSAVAPSCTQRSPHSGAGTGLAPTPRNLGSVGLAPERMKLMTSGLPANVIDTIQSARATSTQSLYALKWRVFEIWCQDRNVVPFMSSLSDVLTFLQELLEKGLSFATIKVYLSAISACHFGWEGKSPGSHPLVIRFMKGVLRRKPPLRVVIPRWDLALVLDALCHAPFEPLESVDVDVLSYKTALLLALCSAKRVGDIHALSVHRSCIQFAPDASRVMLHPNPAYIPKVPALSYRSLSFELSAFSPPPFASAEQKRLNCLCPVRALRLYVERTQGWRKTEQLFVCFAKPRAGKALSKQRLSHWIVEAISRAYASKSVEMPRGVRAHSTRGIATSWALFKGVSVEEICSAANWSSPNTFVKFYCLDVTGQDVTQAVLSAGR